MNRTDVVCVGQALVDSILKDWNETPVNGNVYQADGVSIRCGGDALNEATILARLGMSVKLMCGLGRDEPGELILRSAKKSGIDLSAVVVSDTDPTPVTCLIVDPSGERKTINTPAHLIPFYHPDVREFEGAKVVSVASLFRAPFHDAEEILHVLKSAKENGAIVTADVKIANCRQLYLDDVKAALPYIDYFFPNETEASFYTGRDQDEVSAMADVILGYGIHNVIIKVGAKGCFVKNSEEAFMVPAFHVNAVDATGAGDNFAAAFITSMIGQEQNGPMRLLNSAELHRAVEFATAAAAICVQSIGATTGVTGRQQVEAFLQQMQQ